MRSDSLNDCGLRTLPHRPGTLPPDEPLQIDIRHPADIKTVYCEELYLDGSASGAHGIARVSLNGAPVRIVPGRTVYFSRLVELAEGENRIVVEAEDRRGRRVSDGVTVVRAVPSAHRISARMSLAIMPFERTGTPTSRADAAYEALIGAFVNRRRFNVVSRGAELESVLAELALSRSGLVDQAGAVQAGRLIAADALLAGTIRETPGSLEIYARMISTETGAVFDAMDVYGQEPTPAELQRMAHGLALKFTHSLPLLEGMVVRVRGGDIHIDIGGAQNLKPGMKLIVFREGEHIIHPLNGRVLGSDTEELGRATVMHVAEAMSIGRLIDAADSSRIRMRDMIATR
jgi:TolB-like protein